MLAAMEGHCSYVWSGRGRYHTETLLRPPRSVFAASETLVLSNVLSPMPAAITPPNRCSYWSRSLSSPRKFKNILRGIIKNSWERYGRDPFDILLFKLCLALGKLLRQNLDVACPAFYKVGPAARFLPMGPYYLGKGSGTAYRLSGRPASAALTLDYLGGLRV